MISQDGYIPRSINKHGYIRYSLNLASISAILKALEKGFNFGSNQQLLSGHSFRLGAALDLLEHGEPLERIMFREGWQTDSSALLHLKNWVF